MKAAATPRQSTTSRYTQLLSRWKFTTARLATPKTQLVKSRDSSQGSRQRQTLGGSKIISTHVKSLVSTPRSTTGTPAKPSVLKKYTKELFRRYDDRTAELTQILRDKVTLQKKVDSLSAQVTALETEIQAQDRLLTQLTPSKASSYPNPQTIQALMDEVRSKLTTAIT